jgi:hypothetical protein
MLLPSRPLGRQVRSVAAYSLLTALMMVTPMLVFVPAALMHCAIRNGRRAAWAALVLAVAIATLYGAAAPATDPNMQKMAWSFLAAVVLAIALPAMAAVPLVERGESFGRVLVFLLAGAMVGLAVTEIVSQRLLSFSPYAAQVAQYAKQSAQVMADRGKGMSPDMLAGAQHWIDFTTYILPAMLLVNATLVFVLSLLMLGRLKAWREATVRRGDATVLGVYLFRNFALPDWLLFVFVLGGLTPLASGLLQKIAANTLAVVVFLFILQGLAIFRFVLSAMGAGFAGTMLGWLILAVLTLTGGIGPLLLGMAGLFDPFFDFRHFKKRKDDSHESHSD